jgi:hypothetical protein
VTQDPNAFLKGAKMPNFKFDVGASVTGVIKDMSVKQQIDFDTDQPKFWDDGGPMMQLVVTLATALRDPSIENDNGMRRIYVKGKLQQAVLDAVNVTHPEGLEVGGQLTVTNTGLGEPKKKGANAPRLYSASYVPAATVALQAGQTTTAAPQIPQQQVASPPVVQQQPVAAVPSAPPAVDPAAAAAAIAALTPEQRAALGLPPA